MANLEEELGGPQTNLDWTQFAEEVFTARQTWDDLTWLKKACVWLCTHQLLAAAWPSTLRAAASHAPKPQLQYVVCLKRALRGQMLPLPAAALQTRIDAVYPRAIRPVAAR